MAGAPRRAFVMVGRRSRPPGAPERVGTRAVPGIERPWAPSAGARARDRRGTRDRARPGPRRPIRTGIRDPDPRRDLDGGVGNQIADVPGVTLQADGGSLVTQCATRPARCDAEPP